MKSLLSLHSSTLGAGYTEVESNDKLKTITVNFYNKCFIVCMFIYLM